MLKHFTGLEVQFSFFRPDPSSVPAAALAFSRFRHQCTPWQSLSSQSRANSDSSVDQNLAPICSSRLHSVLAQQTLDESVHPLGPELDNLLGESLLEESRGV